MKATNQAVSRAHQRGARHASEHLEADRETGEHMTPTTRIRFEKDVVSGLTQEKKTLPCKYFYDARGSRLFEEICKTPEYYVTRTETTLLRRACPEVAKVIGPGVDVLEPGAGAGEKIRILLDALDSPRSFIPVDISQTALEAAAESLRADYPGVDIHPLVADFTRPFDLPRHFFERQGEAPGVHHRKMIFFPGSTISNFTPNDARPFLAGLRRVLAPGDFLFIGVDRIKDRTILERAYDDAQGVTARFNLNLLERVRRELDTDLDPNDFSHRAIYNSELSRIEMHLDSRRDQTISVCGRRISFRKGESIHTENSYKYSPEGFRELARDAGYEVKVIYSDDAGLFSLYLCAVFG